MLKKTIICLLLIFIVFLSFAEQYDVFFDLQFDNKIKIKDCERSLCQSFYDRNEFFFYENEIIYYSEDAIYMTVLSIVNKSQSELLYKLTNARILKPEVISNSSWIKERWNEGQLFYKDNKKIIKEYIRDTATEMDTDYFIFLVKKNDESESISVHEIKFTNLYSTYIDKGGYTSPWNRETVKNYKNQNNPGIQLYYLVEEAMKKINVKQPSIKITGILNDDKVRFRKKANLSCETIRLLKESEGLEILDVSEKTETIGKDTFPWIYVKDSNGKTGYIYGKYLDVKVDIQ